MPPHRALRSLEVCAGAGGQALGLEQAGFDHAALVEIDSVACSTLRLNRPGWNVIEADLREFKAHEFDGIDLLAGGVPCPPFSYAGKQLGEQDERDLFPEIIRLAAECRPKAVLVENVRGLLDRRFDGYRARVESELGDLTEHIREAWGDFTAELSVVGYDVVGWQLLNAKDFGVPQLRPRVVMVAIQKGLSGCFEWPAPQTPRGRTVGPALRSEMERGGWEGAEAWANQARRVAPTIVGGSKKHGGPDLGPTRAKRAWAKLGVNAHSIAETPPPRGFSGSPRLTVRMAAIVQGFPRSWKFAGGKTQQYRQVGNAFPPPVAKAVGRAIRKSLSD